MDIASVIIRFGYGPDIALHSSILCAIELCPLTHTDLHHHGSILKSCEAVTSETASNVGAGAITTQIRRDTTFINICKKKRTLKDELSHNKVDRGISTPPGCHACYPQYSVRLPQENSLISKHQSSPSLTHIRELK